MHFLHPSILWFSFLTIIPIIIHLFYFRRYKTEYFSQTELLENIVKQSRSQQKLRNLIILLLRILFILMLVFSFSQPYIKQNQISTGTGAKIYALYIDNTFSMNDEGLNGISLLEEAKSKAITFVQSLPKNTQYFLYYHGMNIPTDKLLSSEEVQKKITEISISPASSAWSEVFSVLHRIIQRFIGTGNISLVWFTDGQRYAVDYSLWKKDSLEFYLFHQLPAKLNNISIDSIWFETPQHFVKQKEKLWVKITNHGTSDLNAIPVKLYLNDTLKSVLTVNLPALNSQKVLFDYVNTKKGLQNGKIEVSDFPITFDNIFYFSYQVYESIKVAIITENVPSYFVSFFKADSIFLPSYYKLNNLSVSSLYDKHAIVIHHSENISSGIWKELSNLVKKGRTLVFIPSSSLQLENINNIISELGGSYSTKDTAKWNISIASYEQEFFKGMFTKREDKVRMPWVKLKYPFRIFTNFPYDVILNYENGQPAFVKINYEKGKIYFLTFPISSDNTNFYTHPLFVSLWYRTFQQSIWSPDLYYILNSNLSFNVWLDTIRSEKTYELKNLKTQTSQIPLQQVRIGELIVTPIVNEMEDGFYALQQENKIITNLSFNYSRKESEMFFYNTNEIKKLLENSGYIVKSFVAQDINLLKQEIKQESKGIQLWKWFVLLAIIMILAEMAVIRFWKVA